MVLAVAASVAALLPWLIDAGPALRYAIDIDVYRAGARAFLEGDNLYTRSYEVGGITLPFTDPPLAAILFIPVALVPYPVALVGWTLASAVLLWWCLVIVLRHAVPAVNHRVIATWILPLALLAEPVRETLGFGQINIILMALVLADTLTRRPWLPRGVLIGLAAAIKLTPAVFILVFLVRRQWRDAAVTFLSGWASPGRRPGELAQLLDLLAGHPHRHRAHRRRGLRLNQSIRASWPASPSRVNRPTACCGWCWSSGRSGLIIVAMLRAQTMLATVLLASTAALLCSPVSWSHHWVWLIPVAVTLLLGPGRVLGRGRPAGRLHLPHWLLPNNHGAEHAWPWWAQLVGSSCLLVTLAVVVAAIVSPRVLAGRR